MVGNVGNVLCTLLAIFKMDTNKDLQQSAGNPAWCYVPAWMGVGLGGE